MRTKQELDALLSDTSFANAGCIQLVEIIMNKYDAPLPMLRQTELSVKTNHYVEIL